MRRAREIVGAVVSRARRIRALSGRTSRRSLALGSVLLAVSAVTVWATTNSPPHITSATLTPSHIQEGQTVTLAVTFTDPDVTDRHTAIIGWRDRMPFQRVQIPAGQSSFSVQHTYQDNLFDPSETSIGFEVQDHQLPEGTNDNTDGKGQDGASVPIVVDNVAPTFGPDLTVTGPTAQSGLVVIQGSLIDPGTADTLQVVANWGDSRQPPFPPDGQPTGTPCLVDRNRHFICQRTFTLTPFHPRADTIALAVLDDDGGHSFFRRTIQIP